MQTKKCKYCNKDIHIKAEICPNCGCRVKSNIFKILVISIIVIGSLIGIYMGVITIKDKIRYNKMAKNKENERIRMDNILNSLVGSYSINNPKSIEISTNTGDYTMEYALLDKVIINKDDIQYLDGTYIHYIGVDKSIYVYEDNNDIFMIIYVQDIVSDDVDSIHNRYACLKLDSNSFKQVKCKSGIYDSVVNELDDSGIMMKKI